MRIAVTGAAHGIGAESARLLKERGAHVTAYDIDKPVGVDEWVQVDMADPASVDAALSQGGGPFDALLNIAGIPPRADNAAAILAVNFLGLRRFTLGMLDRLAPGAAIVNLSSRAGHRWRENLAQVKAFMAQDFDGVADFVADRGIDPVRAYDLSKEAVTCWTRGSIDAMIARGVRMNAVSPAAISSRILGDFMTAFGDRASRMVARVGRPGTPEEVARVVVFLATPESAWIRGTEIEVDGGTTAVALTDTLGLA